ncbi:MAG: hypothetical protein WC497_01575 [Patescibacteria group bacterium]
MIRFLFFLTLTIILLKLFLPEVAVPALAIIHSGLAMVGTMLQNLLETFPRA